MANSIYFRWQFISTLLICLLLFSMDSLASPLNQAATWQEQDKDTRQDKKPENKPEVKSGIKEVPKSRKQPKPTVVKPDIKVKPVKIIKPKIKKH